MRTAGTDLSMAAHPHRWIALILAALAAAACSGGGEPADADASVTTTAPDVAASTTTPDATVETDRSDPPTTPPETAPPTTAPPEPVPVGVRWTESDTLVEGVKGVTGTRLLPVGDDLWALVDLVDDTLTFVSHDSGATFTPIQITAPQPGSIRVQSIVVRPDGGYLAYGERGTECYDPAQLTDGYVGFDVCTRYQGVVWLSPDGVTWEQVEPSGLTAPGDAVFNLVGVVATPSGFVAAATIASLDWHSRLYSSPDGRTWTVAREMRGEGTGPLSISAIVSDGATVAVLGAEHTCAEPQYSNNSYQPDVGWMNRPRLYLGTDADDLVLVPDAELPIADVPVDVDCSVTDSFDLGRLPRTEVRARLVGGAIALIGEPYLGADAEPTDEERATGGARLVALLEDGEWRETTVEGVPMLDVDRVVSRVVAAPSTAAGIAIVEFGRSRDYQIVPTVMVDAGDGTIVPVEVAHPLLADEVGDAATSGDGLLAIGERVSRTGVTSSYDLQIPRDVLLWRSDPTSGPEDLPCDLAAGGTCRFGDVTTLDGYPDFAGSELGGIDLVLTELGAAVFDGADLSGATMWSAGAQDASFVGANLTGAQLQYGRFGSLVDANLDGADLTGATVDDATGASLRGTVLTDARLGLNAPTDLSAAVTVGVHLELNAAVDWSLAGLDLSDSYIDPIWVDDAKVVRIVDLTGTNLEWANLSGVDLSAIDPASVDLSKTAVDADSICPDGQPPDTDVVFSGGCVR